MPKNWDLHRTEIEELYMKRGHTLLSVKNFIKAKYGFDASTRAYRMRLDQWQMRKNKCRLRSTAKPDHRFCEDSWRDLESDSTPTAFRKPEETLTPMTITTTDYSIFSAQPGPVEPITPATGNAGPTVSDLEDSPLEFPPMGFAKSVTNLQSPLERSSAPSLIHHQLASTSMNRPVARANFQSAAVLMPASDSTQSPSTIAPTTTTSIGDSKTHNNFQNPLVNMVNDAPLANLSFMFFSTRPLHESLERLASSPLMAPLALEILLRNWKAGSNCLEYALAFVKDGSYCTSILSMNWTRWWHNDETLFDLVEDNVPKDEQNIVIKAFLKADLKFRCQLGKLCAPWAGEWRSAIQQEEWVKARRIVMSFEASKRLRRCALGVIAEHMLAEFRDYIELEKNSNGEGHPTTRKSGAKVASVRYLEILQDGRHKKADIDSSWYEYASDIELGKCSTSQVPAT